MAQLSEFHYVYLTSWTASLLRAVIQEGHCGRGCWILLNFLVEAWYCAIEYKMVDLSVLWCMKERI
jgi:hypothetical protein